MSRGERRSGMIGEMRALGVLLVLVVAAAATLWWRSDAVAPTTADPAPSRTPGPAEPAAASPAPRATASPPAEAAAPSQRTPVAPAGLFGVVRDHDGEALAGIRLHLLADGAPERERRIARADADGAFGYPDVHGTFVLSIWNALRCAREVTLAPGERRFVELRVDEPCVLLTGVVHRGDVPVPDREVLASGHDGTVDVLHTDVTDDDGVFRHLLRPGDYELAVSGPPTVMELRARGYDIPVVAAGTPVTVAAVTLRRLPTRVRHDIVLPPFAVHVRALAAVDHTPVLGARVRAERVDAAGRRELLTDDGGGARFAELPGGTWRITVTSPGHLPVPDQTVAAGERAPFPEVTFVLPRAGRIDVKLVDRDGRLLACRDPSRLQLQVAGHAPRPGERANNGLLFLYAAHFASVPPGRHVLHCDDERDGDGRILFAPFVPFAPQTVDVRAAETTEVELGVQPRPELRVHVVDRDEREVDATIRVAGPTAAVAPWEHADGTWFSPVPPGDYELTVTDRAGTVLRRETVPVLGADVEHVVQLDG